MIVTVYIAIRFVIRGIIYQCVVVMYTDMISELQSVHTLFRITRIVTDS